MFEITVMPALALGIIATGISALAALPPEAATSGPVPGLNNTGQIILLLAGLASSAFTAWLVLRRDKISQQREIARLIHEKEMREMDLEDRRLAREELHLKLDDVKKVAATTVPVALVETAIQTLANKEEK